MTSAPSTIPMPPEQEACPNQGARGLMDAVEKIRLEANRSLDAPRRSLFGQFMTPASIALFMASMVSPRRRHVRLLDPGAGVGSLTAAFITQMTAKRNRPRNVSAVCYEIDSLLARRLAEVLRLCRNAARDAGIEFEYEIRETDFIADRASCAAALFAGDDDVYDCVIMNPPYRKIHSASREREWLRRLGIETTNLYTGFMLLAARQLRSGGEFVSINPRSFCSGPYFRPFRREFLSRIAFNELHIFESRNQAFKEDDVLQENVIIHGRRSDEKPSTVAVSMTASDGSIVRRRIPYGRVVQPDDPDAIVHIVIDASSDEIAERMRLLRHNLADLGLEVSTGRVVDFRAREALRSEPGKRTVPLIYPAHFHNGLVEWPNGQTRKANAIVANQDTEDLLVDSGFYVLVKRFSAKEERRRIVAAIYDPHRVTADRVGFENHLNYFHTRRNGIDCAVARGLAVYLNSTIVDRYFRQFSGHTQVNAADLRNLPYPNVSQLKRLARSCGNLADQVEIDRAVDLLFQSS